MNEHKLAFAAVPAEIAPADARLQALRDATASVESIGLMATSIMARKMAAGIDALVLDVKVGSGAFIKKQIDARRLAQLMVGIGRRMDKKVQALITDMNQPLGFAIGNALEVMEVSQTLQNVGPTDLTRLSLELAARMIFLGKITATLEEARELAQSKLLDGSGYRKLKEVITAQGGDARVMDRFELLPNATGAREINSPRAGYVSAIDAEGIGQASAMIGAGRENKDDAIDPAVGVILEVKVGQKVDAGGVLCRLYYTREDLVEEAAQIGGRRFPHLVQRSRRTRADSRSRRLIQAVQKCSGSPGCWDWSSSSPSRSCFRTTAGRFARASFTGAWDSSSASRSWS